MTVRLQSSQVQLSGDYARVVLADTPVAYYRLGASAADSSGNAYTLTLGSGATSDAAGAISDGTAATRFDGTANAKATTASDYAGLKFAGSFSIEAWINPDDLTTRGFVVCKGLGGSAADTSWWLERAASGKVTFQISNGVNQFSISSLTTPPALQWTHVVATYDNATKIQRAYINGVLNQTGAAITGSPNNITTPVAVGALGLGGSLNFLGSLDDVALYNRVLSATEITEHYYAGPWHDVSADVLARSARWKRGINGSGPTDRTAHTGVLSFDLRNDAGNSAGLLGYYSPDHANCRVGFSTNLRCRLRLQYASTYYDAFTGRIADLVPRPGRHGERVVNVTVTDWMDYAASQKAKQTTLQVEKRFDEIVDHLVSLVPVAPEATDFDEGFDVFEYALDQRGNTGSILEEIDKAVQSELGYAYVTVDGTLALDNRHARLRRASAATFDNTMSGLEARRSRSGVLNRVTVTVHPRRVDTTATSVLYEHDAVPLLGAGESLIVDAQYRDPLLAAEEVGGRDVAATVGVDILGNSAEDGSGTDLSASIDATGTFFGANAARFVLTNTGAGAMWLTLLRCIGRGVYDYSPLTAISEDTASQAVDGLNELEIDMPYQGNVINAQLAADWFASLYGPGLTSVLKMPIDPCGDATRMGYGLTLEIGQRITVIEDVTGVSHEYFINAIDGELLTGHVFRLAYTLSPASDDDGLWVLDDPVKSVLDSTTKLGWL